MTTPVKTMGLTVLILALVGIVWGSGYLWERAGQDHSPAVEQAQVVSEKIDQALVWNTSPTSSQVTSTSTVRESRDNVYENTRTRTQISFVGDRTVNRQPRLGNPFVFYGTTTVFENQFAWRVKDGKRKIVAEGPAYASSSDMGLPGSFRINGLFDTMPQTTEGVLEVYDASPKDGSEVMLLSVSVKFQDLQSQEVTVYFGNTKKNPKMLDCSLVFPVIRKTVATSHPPEEAAVYQLLKGPTEAEKRAGYFTSLPERVNQPNMHWEDEGLVVDFDVSLEVGVAGSCRVSAIRAQIEKTIGSICSEGMCLLMVNGRMDDILQP